MLPGWVTFHKYRLCKSYVTQLDYLSLVQALSILCNPVGIPFIRAGFVNHIEPSWDKFHKYRLCQSYVTQLGYLS